MYVCVCDSRIVITLSFCIPIVSSSSLMRVRMYNRYKYKSQANISQYNTAQSLSYHYGFSRFFFLFFFPLTRPMRFSHRLLLQYQVLNHIIVFLYIYISNIYNIYNIYNIKIDEIYSIDQAHLVHNKKKIVSPSRSHSLVSDLPSLCRPPLSILCILIIST